MNANGRRAPLFDRAAGLTNSDGPIGCAQSHLRPELAFMIYWPQTMSALAERA